MWIYFPLLKRYYSYRPNESHEVTVIHKMIKIYPVTADRYDYNLSNDTRRVDKLQKIFRTK